MKNVILVGVIVVCLAVAGLVVFKGGGGKGGIDSIPDDEKILTLCMACNNVKEMNKKEYHLQMQEKQSELIKAGNPMAKAYITCEKCGKDAVTEALKCEKCENVFRKGTPGDYDDRCPKCKYSPTEARFKARNAG